MVMDSSKDRSQASLFHKGEMSGDGKKWLKEMGLVDIWREVHPTSTQYTFYSHAHKSYARLDYFLGTGEINSVVDAVSIEPAALSGHDAMTVQL